MATDKERKILEAVRRGLISKEQARERIVALRQQPTQLPDDSPFAPIPPQPAPPEQASDDRGLFERVGDRAASAAQSVYGEQIGLDPDESQELFRQTEDLPFGVRQVAEFGATAIPAVAEGALAAAAGVSAGIDEATGLSETIGGYAKAIDEIADDLGIDRRLRRDVYGLLFDTPILGTAPLPQVTGQALRAGGMAARNAVRRRGRGAPDNGIETPTIENANDLPTPAQSGASGLATSRAAGREVVEAGERFDVPVMTTDVLPPKTAAGRLTQQAVEKLPFVGTGGLRRASQSKREQLVENIANSIGVDSAAPLEARIIESLAEKKSAQMSRAANQRQQALSTLNEFGPVDTSRIVEAVGDEIAKLQKMGFEGDARKIRQLQEYADLTTGTFEDVAAIRSRLIGELNALADPNTPFTTVDEAILQRVKSSMDGALKEFASKNDKRAANLWEKSNKIFAEEYGKFKNTELKRILAKGEATPEIVTRVLRGNRRSELSRLYNNLTPKGQDNARAVILRDALEKSGWPDQINPNRFVSELNRPAVKSATDVFFRDGDKDMIEGLRKVLNATRRSQDASVTTPTGQAAIPFIGGAIAANSPITSFLTATTIGGLGRLYESKSVRNMLLRIGRDKKNKPETQKQIERLSGIIAAATIANNEGVEENDQ